MIWLDRKGNRMGTILAAAVSSLVAYFIGTTVELLDGVHLPGFGLTLTVITMGAFILFQLRKPH